MITTEGKTVEEVVDEIFIKLNKQGHRSMKRIGPPERSIHQCAYSDDKGGHCAVGWLLDPDNEEAMNFGGSITGLSAKKLGSNRKFIEDNIELMGVMQRIHDSTDKTAMTAGKQRLKELCTIPESANTWINNMDARKRAEIGSGDTS